MQLMHPNQGHVTATLVTLDTYMYMYIVHVYVMRKARIWTIRGFRCAKLGLALCAILFLALREGVAPRGYPTTCKYNKYLAVALLGGQLRLQKDLSIHNAGLLPT